MGVLVLSGFFGACFGQTGRAVARGRNREPTGFAQVQTQKIDNVLFVFDDENPLARHRVHAREGLRFSYCGSPAAAVFTPAFSFKVWVNSCKLETICGALLNTVVASFSA